MSCVQKLFCLFLVSPILFHAPTVLGAELSLAGKPVVDVIEELILYLLKLMGGIFLLMFISGGIYYAVSGSSPDGQSKAKKIIAYAILGLAVILISYSLLTLLDQIFVQP